MRIKNHPRATKQRYVKRSILVAEEMLNRSLAENEVVHHMDGDTQNDVASNLKILVRPDHKRLHSKALAKTRSRDSFGRFISEKGGKTDGKRRGTY